MRTPAVVALCLASACGGDGAGSSTPIARIQIDWDRTIGEVTRTHLGHNAVWSRGGLGLWDDETRSVDEDALDLVRTLAPGALRFPGGTRAMRYRFAQAIGSIEDRLPQCDTFTGELDATAYGLDEFLLVAEELGADVSLVTPWTDGSPEEAAAMIAYVNADPSSTVDIGIDVHGVDWGTAGEWARRRVDNGHPAPYGVRFLEVGNETYLDLGVGPATSCGRPSRFRQSERWVDDMPIPTTAADYATQAAATAERVHAVDPTVLVGAAAYAEYDGTDAATLVSDVDRELGTDDPWNQRLVAEAGGQIDFLVLHPYDFSTGDTRFTLAERMRETIVQLRSIAPELEIAVTEFGFLFDGGTMLNALVSADVVRVSIEEGVMLTMRHILIEDLPTDPFSDSAAILGAGDDRALLPAYHVMRLLSAELLPVAVPASGSGDVVALATRDESTDAIAVVAIDRRVDPIDPSRVTFDLPDGAWSGTIHVVSGPSAYAREESIAVDSVALDDVERTVAIDLPASAVAVVALARSR